MTQRPPSISCESEAGATLREAAAHCCCQAQILLKGKLAPAGGGQATRSGFA